MSKFPNIGGDFDWGSKNPAKPKTVKEKHYTVPKYGVVAIPKPKKGKKFKFDKYIDKE